MLCDKKSLQQQIDECLHSRVAYKEKVWAEKIMGTY